MADNLHVGDSNFSQSFDGNDGTAEKSVANNQPESVHSSIAGSRHNHLLLFYFHDAIDHSQIGSVLQRTKQKCNRSIGRRKSDYAGERLSTFIQLLDRVCNHPDDIGCCVPSTHQSSQTFLVDIYIDLLFYIFQHIP